MTKTEIKKRPKPVRRTTPGAEAWEEPAPIPAATKIAGSDLVPHPTATVGHAREYWYWIGVTAECPTAFLTAGGIAFPKDEEIIEPDLTRKGRPTRRPVFGTIHKLNEGQIRLILDHLPRRVVRSLPGQNADGSRKACEVRIPSDEKVAEAKKHRRPSPEYVAQKDDEPAARYMFAVLCPDQDNPTRGHHYPKSLEEEGLEWPDKLE